MGARAVRPLVCVWEDESVSLIYTLRGLDALISRMGLDASDVRFSYSVTRLDSGLDYPGSDREWMKDALGLLKDGLIEKLYMRVPNGTTYAFKRPVTYGGTNF